MVQTFCEAVKTGDLTCVNNHWCWVEVMTTTGSGQRVIVIAVDASDNAKDAFDCTYRDRF